jgi:hypothetical protein
MLKEVLTATLTDYKSARQTKTRTKTTPAVPTFISNVARNQKCEIRFLNNNPYREIWSFIRYSPKYFIQKSSTTF